MSEEAIISEQKELKIIDLNDDCLFAILRFLNTTAFIRLSRTNSRFHSAIKLILPITTVQINGRRLPKREYLENFIRDFGGHIKEFSIKNLGHIPLSYVRTIERLLTEYCANGNLEKCAFKDGKITKEFTATSKLFESLKSLELKKVCIFDGNLNAVQNGELVNDLIRKSKMLTELKIDTCTADIRDLLTTINTCPNIETVKMTYMQTRRRERTPAEILMEINAQPTDRDLPTCNSIKGLKLVNCYENPRLLNGFPNAERLTLNYYAFPWLESICALEMLKELRMSVRSSGGYAQQDEMDSIFRQLSVNLEVLHLYLGDLQLNDELTKGILKMTNLKKLYLGSDRSFNRNCVNLASNLANLRIFHFNGYLDIRNDILCEPSMVIDFIRIAENLQTFVFQTRKDPRNEADELYERLVDVCTAENRRTVLKVNVVVFVAHLPKKIYLYKSKWLKMSIYQN